MKPVIKRELGFLFPLSVRERPRWMFERRHVTWLDEPLEQRLVIDEVALALVIEVRDASATG